MKLFSPTQVLHKYQDWSFVDPDVLDARSEEGILVHEYAKNYASGLWAPIRGDVLGYCLSFRNWFSKYVSQVFAVEKELEDDDLGIICHIDLIGRLTGDKNGDLSIIDYKTGLTTGRTWQSQVAVYIHIANKNGFAVKRGGDLKLKKNGGVAQYIPCDTKGQDLAAFISALNAHRFYLGD